MIDAFWRLDLISNLIENVSDSRVEEKFSFSNRLKSKCIFYGQKNESSSEEIEQEQRKSDIEVSSETGSIDANLWRKKRGKNQISLAESTALAKGNNSKFIVNFMLASTESMVFLCIWKGDYARAQQIIEVCNSFYRFLNADSNFS